MSLAGTITILRERNGFEYTLLVNCAFNHAGVLESKVGEDVNEKYWSRHFGKPQPDFTGELAFREGNPIKLEDDEIEEAKQAIAQLHADYEAILTRAGLTRITDKEAA